MHTGQLEGVREGEGVREREREGESRGMERASERERESERSREGGREAETSIRESSGPQPLSKRLHPHPTVVKHVYGGDAVTLWQCS